MRRNHPVKTAIIESTDVAAGHTHENAVDFPIRHLFRLRHRLAQVLLHLSGIDDLALAHPARQALPDPDDVERTIRFYFADDDIDFRRADFNPGNDAGDT